MALRELGSQVIRGNLLVVSIERSLVYVEPLYIAAEKGQLPELKRVIVGFGDRIAMEETLDSAMARVFSGPAPRARVEGSVKTLLDAAASALTRATEELRRVNELLQRLREAGAGLDRLGKTARSYGS